MTEKYFSKNADRETMETELRWQEEKSNSARLKYVKEDNRLYEMQREFEERWQNEEDDCEVIAQVDQGKVRVSSIIMRRLADNIVFVSIDMHTKYAEIAFIGGEEIALMPGEYTLRADETAPNDTLITFPDWTIQSANVSKYTCNIFLTREIDMFDNDSEVWETLWEDE